MIRLELDMNLASILGLSKLCFSYVPDKKNILALKRELTIAKSKNKPLLIGFEEEKSMIEIVLDFIQNF